MEIFEIIVEVKVVNDLWIEFHGPRIRERLLKPEINRRVNVTDRESASASRRGGERVALRREPRRDPEELAGEQSPGAVGA